MNKLKQIGFISTLGVLLILTSCSKERVLQVNKFPNQTAEGSDIYLTGTFNNWNPADPNYKLEYDNVLHVYSVELPDDVKDGYYLYTRGSAASIESDICGNDRELRTLTPAEISFDSIDGWADLDHPGCPNITFIVRADSGEVPATDLIYLTTESINWEDKNESLKFKNEANGTSVLFTHRSPKNGLLFNVFHNGVKQFDRPVEAPTFNDTISLTLSASASAAVRKVKMNFATGKTQNRTQLPLPSSIPKTITLDPQPTKTIPVPPQYRVPVPQPVKVQDPHQEEVPKTSTPLEEAPAQVEETKPIPDVVAVPVPKPTAPVVVEAPKPTAPKPAQAPQVAEQAVELDKRKKVIVIIDKIPTYGKEDAFYASGDFNDWNVADPNFKFGELGNGKRFLVMRMNDYSAHDFKITRGEPGTDEANYKEEPIDFHEIKKGKEDDTIHVRIDSWLDAYARSRLVFYLIDVPESTPENAPIYLAGDFNKWNLKDDKYKFTYLGDDRYSLVIDDFSNRYQYYKISRGSEENEAVARNGRIPGPQPFAFIRRDTLRLRIERWKDLR